MKTLIVTVVAGTFTLCGVAYSQAAEPPARTVPSSSHEFVKEALAGGMAEVELGKLAQEKATNADVKKFAQRMVEDHTKTGDELKAIAASQQVTLPVDLAPKDKALRDRLSRLSGRAFDRAYMQSMIRDHVNDVSLFRHEAQIGKNDDAGMFAAKALPTLRDHLAMARHTSKEVGL